MIHRHDGVGDCLGCGKGHPITPTGHCPACAATACSEGDGKRVGLPTVPEVQAHRATEVIRRHLADPYTLLAPPGCCPVCAHLSPVCPDCGHTTADMDGEEADQHVLTDGGTVLIGCEGFQTVILRAAAEHMRDLRNRTGGIL